MTDESKHHDTEPTADECCENTMDPPPSTAAEVADALDALRIVLNSKVANKFLSIIETKHTRQIELDAKANERHEKVLEAQIKVANRWSWVFGFCVLFSFGFLTAVIWLLKDSPDALLPVVTALVGLIAGTGGGWVFGHKATKIQE